MDTWGKPPGLCSAGDLGHPSTCLGRSLGAPQKDADGKPSVYLRCGGV